MAIVVGVDPVGPDRDALALAAHLQQLIGGHIVLVSVRPPTIEVPSRGNVDAEWTAYLHEHAQTALDAAEDVLTRARGIAPVETRIVANASVSRGLRAAANDVAASAIVIGSGSRGAARHLHLGSVAQSLLHSGETGIALAPSGYADGATPITRLVVGFEGDRESESVVASALDMARASHAAVELLTVVARVTRIWAPRLGADPERAVLEALIEQAQHEQARMRAQFPAIGGAAIEHADSVQGAIDQFEWRSHDLFILGSSADGILRRVFLGDTSHQLLRSVRVPALVLPRGTDEEHAPAGG